MIMTLVQALLQPNYSFYKTNNEETYTKIYSDMDSQDRGPKTSIVIANDDVLNDDVSKHVVQSSTVAIDEKINNRIDKQHAVKNHEIHISVNDDRCKVSQIETKVKKDTSGRKWKLKTVNIQNNHLYKKHIIKLMIIICVMGVIQANNLIILLNNKVYLYLKSQLIKYNYTMEIHDETYSKTIYVNWKISTETYDMMCKHFKALNINRKYSITWKLLSLLMNDISAFKEIVWYLNKSNNENEDKTKTKQEGAKSVIYMMDTDLKYDIIGMSGTKVKLNDETIAKYVEVLDLIKSYNEHRPLPIENGKFGRKLLNIDKDIWIKGGKIILNDCIKEVWHVIENYVILCEASNEPNNEINNHKQANETLDQEIDRNGFTDDELMKDPDK